jgi:uncharacterized repeat protein (TIGR04042 family)
MPEAWVTVGWPDGSEEVCYSPSTIVEEYFAPGRRYPAGDFLSRARAAWRIASERVEAKFGFRCNRADAQLRAIEETMAHLDAAAEVSVIRIGRAPPEPRLTTRGRAR